MGLKTRPESLKVETSLLVGCFFTESVTDVECGMKAGENVGGCWSYRLSQSGCPSPASQESTAAGEERSGEDVQGWAHQASSLTTAHQSDHQQTGSCKVPAVTQPSGPHFPRLSVRQPDQTVMMMAMMIKCLLCTDSPPRAGHCAFPHFIT